MLRRIAVASVAAALAAWSAPAEDAVTALARRLEQGPERLSFDPAYGYLPALLEALRIPVESQMAVFSKTSIQGMIIQPSNPRVLYFNDAVAAGWVRGGFIELASQNPGHGIEFWVIMQRPGERLTRRRDCVKCHTSSKLLLSSVRPSASGVPSDETEVDNRTPLDKLWGGWFVTGEVGPGAHRGNAVFADSGKRGLEPVLDPRFSLTPSSDVVALMVFAHQKRAMNLLAEAETDAAKATELADSLLFADEAPLPGKLGGNSDFARKFTEMGPPDAAGRSLRDFDLRGRLMRYPCSYMIYSDAFDALPDAVKRAVYERMWKILSGAVTGPRYARRTREERRAAVDILRETKAGLPDYFGGEVR